MLVYYSLVDFPIADFPRWSPTFHHRPPICVGTKGSHPLLQPSRMQLRYGASVDMPEEVGTADFSVPY
jgi:hypothetical protein